MALSKWLWLGIVCLPSVVTGDEATLFRREVLPLLSENCFQCHGPDEANREAGLRLDQHASLLRASDSGEAAVVPGDRQQSPLFRRIASGDPDSVMPPPETGKSLTKDQIQRIGRWIDSGAAWAGHWSHEKPTSPPVPSAVDGWKATGAIDRFIHVELQKAGLAPEPEADRATLLRRISLDLTGLPPSLQAINRFLRDESPDALQRAVDRLLASPEFGEQMGRVWLDAARFADTHGLHLDNERSIWPYRNWVIESFNRDMPFDQFTVEQLAGDLLPDATLSQRVATGFNRCNVTTGEGGSIDEEYYVRYAVDRVETTSTVWLGLTAGCAACHDHKFDPLTQKEFYELFSYFFSLTEKAMDGNVLLPPPSIKVPTEAQTLRRARYAEDLVAAKANVRRLLDEVRYQDPSPDEQLGELSQTDSFWIDDELPAGAKPQGDGQDPWRFVSGPTHPVFRGETSTVRTAGSGLSQHFFSDANPKLTIGVPGRLFAHVFLDPDDPPETIQLQFNDGSWNHRAYWGADKAHGAGQKGAANHRVGDLPETGRWVRLEVEATDVGLTSDSQLHGWAFTQYGGTVHWDAAGTVTTAPPAPAQLASLNLWQQYRAQVKSPALPGEIQKLLEVADGERDEGQQKQIREYFVQYVHPDLKQRFNEPLKAAATASKNISELEKRIPATLVMEDRKEPRQAHVLERGEYTAKGEPVSPNVPAWISSPAEGSPPNRLGLAEWLVHPDHPLTARVTVNRIWQHHFGTGLVKTSEDFGIQGEQPSHPELLDWLAVRFIESGWNLKRLHKSIVMSATYRQSSRVRTEKYDADPENRLLSRGPRFRLDAESIRDSALAASGLLVRTLGGPSVRPYQPAGLWKPVGFGGSNTSVFRQDNGEKLYRRSMYTFWKRTSPPPSMAMFDAPDRETCRVRRARTNTPLQSLVLMNDVQYVEAARVLAQRIIREGGMTPESRIALAYQTLLTREPRPNESDSLARLLQEFRDKFAAAPESAKAMLAIGESAPDPSLDASELAAWTMLTHLLLNLSETVTRG